MVSEQEHLKRNDLVLLELTLLLGLLIDFINIHIKLGKTYRDPDEEFELLSQVGFCLVEAGTNRLKYTRSIVVRNVQDTCVCEIALWIFGYAFGLGFGSMAGGRFEIGKEALFALRSQVDFFFQFYLAAICNDPCKIAHICLLSWCARTGPSQLSKALAEIDIVLLVLEPITACWAAFAF